MLANTSATPRVSYKNYYKRTKQYHPNTGCLMRLARIMTVHSSVLSATKDANWPAAKAKAKKLPKPRLLPQRLSRSSNQIARQSNAKINLLGFGFVHWKLT